MDNTESPDITSSSTAPQQRRDNHRTRMAVMLNNDSMAYALFDPLASTDTERLQMTDIPLTLAPLAEFPDVTSLEEAVYAHPSMLNDYGRVDVVIDTRDMLLIPGGLNIATVEAIADETLTADSDKTIIETADTIDDARVAIRIPTVLDAFLRRTFNTPRYHHPLAIATRCYSVDTMSPSPVVNLHFGRGRRLYIVVRRDNRLLMANRFDVHADSDVVYYALAAINAVGLTAADVRIRTSGEAERRHSAGELLHHTFDDVAPASLPSPILREGSSALALPIELTTPLLL